ncbi:UDP-N-acetylglucosamine pyrophosphorylase, partial [Aureobasidium melanogenum]
NNVLEKLHLTGNIPAPDEPSQEDFQKLLDKYTKAGQEQVFAFWTDINAAEKGMLYEQLVNIDPDHVNDITHRALNPPKPQSEDTAPKLEQLPESATSSIYDSKPDDLNRWYTQGLQFIAQNQVAVVLMAGGQGTRLGSSAPKGCYDIGLPSQKSLFQLQAERIWKIQQLAQHEHSKEEVIVPWYIMTSGPTRKPTEEFFEKHAYFGLNRNNVIFFEQGTLPCISNEGKILLESKSKVAVAPDGNGGLYNALFKSGVVQDMSKRGIKHIHAYCVDNCLVRVADPTFIGFSASKKVDIATKVVRKRDAKESVGLILSKNGKPDVVEYSEIDKETSEAKDSKDSSLLKFRAANIVNHYYSFDFLESIPQWSDKLPHHIARKKIPYVDTDKGETVKPEKPNGIKLEQFVFDCFPFLSMDKFACQEVKREDEFSPLKNARGTGEDDPDTSKRDIFRQGTRWLEAVGATVTSEDDNAGVEISPKISYGGEGLEFLSERTIKAPAVIEQEKHLNMSSLSRRACYKCGNVGHYAEVCSSSERLCYNCKQPGHESNNCPLPRTTEAKQCYHCQGLGHVQADCPTLRLNGGANGRCYSCGMPGHLARTCPTPGAAAGLGRGAPGPRGGFRGAFVGGPRPATCYKCGGPNHFARDCQAQAMKCYACGKLGHISRECTAPNGGPLNTAGKTCYRCGETGHISRECNQQTEVNGESAPVAAADDAAAAPLPVQTSNAATTIIPASVSV